jgi:hypothetical protein
MEGGRKRTSERTNTYKYTNARTDTDLAIGVVHFAFSVEAAFLERSLCFLFVSPVSSEVQTCIYPTRIVCVCARARHAGSTFNAHWCTHTVYTVPSENE